MRQVFISYARDDRQKVEALAHRLRRLVDSVWFDSQLHGGEDWWAGILERIRGCDIFVAVVSPSSLDSQACRIERQYAAATHRTIVPVALDTLPPVLPSDIATRQIVNFATPGEQALADLARALLAAPDPEPLPDPLPPEPQAPLSYLTNLVDLANSPRELTKSEQMEILYRLERGLQSTDPDEREGARQVLRNLKRRDDLAASAEKTIDLLDSDRVPDQPPPVLGAGAQGQAPTRGPRAEHPTQTAQKGTNGSAIPAAGALPDGAPESGGASEGTGNPTRRGVILAAAAAAIAAILGGITWVLRGSPGEEAGPDESESPTSSPSERESSSPSERESSSPSASESSPPPGDVPTAAVPVGGGTIRTDLNVVVTQPTAGDFNAFTATCPHQDCPVSSIADGLIQCNCHGSKFSISDGSRLEGPAPGPLARVEITVSGGWITLS